MHPLLLVAPRRPDPLQPGLRPAILGWNAFQQEVQRSGGGVPVRFGLVRADGSVSTFPARVLPAGHAAEAANSDLLERLLKFLLWQRGAARVIFGGPRVLGETLAAIGSPHGVRTFDANFLGAAIGGGPLRIDVVGVDDVPDPCERTTAIGRHLDGCRVGFDLGASDRKTSAVVDGVDVFSEEVPWDPKQASDWRYHHEGIRHSILRAKEHLPRLDAIGGSSAGIYVDNEVRAASLFRSVPEADFERHVRPLFRRLGQEFGVPLVVVNDGEVTALAGSMSLQANRVLGVAMGSSQAAGYVTADGRITGWLNELAFAPVDFDPSGPRDEWSGDVGCGVQFFSQQAVMRLAEHAGLTFPAAMAVPERLVEVQRWRLAGHSGAAAVYRSIGIALGYAVAWYCQFYDVEKVLVLGRVTTGPGGEQMLETARRILAEEFPQIAETAELLLPSERLRRVGQAIAAASLPALRR